jgi:uncharacterized protein (DUF2267 family)
VGRIFHVDGGHGGAIPGTLGPAGLDGRLEWVGLSHGPALLDAVRARLGSENDVDKVLLAVLVPLRPWLAGEALDGLLEALPGSLAERVRSGERYLLAPVGRPSGVDEYVAAVARLLQRAPAEARTHVLAVLGAARDALPLEAAAAIAARLPPELARLWDAAR